MKNPGKELTHIQWNQLKIRPGQPHKQDTLFDFFVCVCLSFLVFIFFSLFLLFSCFSLGKEETEKLKKKTKKRHLCNFNNHHKLYLTTITQKHLPIHLGGLLGFQFPCVLHTAVEAP